MPSDNLVKLDSTAFEADSEMKLPIKYVVGG